MDSSKICMRCNPPETELSDLKQGCTTIVVKGKSVPGYRYHDAFAEA